MDAQVEAVTAGEAAARAPPPTRAVSAAEVTYKARPTGEKGGPSHPAVTQDTTTHMFPPRTHTHTQP